MTPIEDSQIEPITSVEPARVSYKADAHNIPADHPDVDRILGAMRQVESGGNYGVTAKDLGHGAYQYEPDTWKTSSTKYAQKMGLGAGPLPMTKEYQDAVARNDVQEFLSQGYSPKQIASLWNSGHPDWEGRRGVNKYGVKYDVPAHVAKFERAYERHNMIDKVFTAASPAPQKPERSFLSYVTDLLGPTSAEAAEGEEPARKPEAITWRWYPDGYHPITPEEQRQASGVQPDWRVKVPPPGEAPPEAIKAKSVTQEEFEQATKGMNLPPLSESESMEAEPEKKPVEPEVERLEPPDTEKPELKDEEPRLKPDIELPSGFEPIADENVIPIGEKVGGLKEVGTKFRTGGELAGPLDESGLPVGAKVVTAKDAQLFSYDPQGYKNLALYGAAAFAEGTAEFFSVLDSTVNFVSRQALPDSISEEARQNAAPADLFKRGVDELRKNAQHYRELIKNPNMAQKIIGTTVGGFIPGSVQFVLGIPWAAISGYEKNGIPGMMEEIVARATLGGVFKAVGPLKPVTGATIVGGAFAAEAAMKGGTPEQIVEAGLTGAVLKGIGGKTGDKSLRDAYKDFRESLPPRLKNESGGIAWHGSPYEFEKFLLKAIGTGEGAQAFGYGLYFASKKEIAEFYRDKLTPTKDTWHDDLWEMATTSVDDEIGIRLREPEVYGTLTKSVLKDIAIDQAEMASDSVADNHRAEQFANRVLDRVRGLDEDKFSVDLNETYSDQGRLLYDGKRYADALSDLQGNLYKVEIPDDSVLLDWDKPLSEQPESVREALLPTRNDRFDLHPQDGTDIETGATAYYRIGDTLAFEQGIENNPRTEAKLASEYLKSLGIPGHGYLDASSRSEGEGTRNYVIYDAEAIKTIERNGRSLLDKLKDTVAGFRESLPERLNDESGAAPIIADAAEWAKKLIDNARQGTKGTVEMVKKAKDSIGGYLGVGGDPRAEAFKIAMFGRRAAEMLQAEFALMGFKKILTAMPKELQYLQAVEFQKGNRAGVDPALLPFFDIVQELTDKNWSAINSVKGRYLNYVDNYLRQSYKNHADPAVQENIKNFFEGLPFDNYLDRVGGNPTKYVRTINAQGNIVYTPVGPAAPGARAEPEVLPQRTRLGGKTLTGGRSYFRQRTFDSYLEPLMVGLEPKYDNLYDLMMADHDEKTHYITGMRYWNALRKAGDIKFFRIGNQPPDWIKIQDPMGRVVTAITTQEGPRAIIQEAYAPPKVALVLNNFLSEGLRGKPWYDFYRAVGDPIRKLGVSFSPFHAKVTINNDIATGIGENGSHALGALFTGDGAAAAKQAKELGKALIFWKSVSNQREARRITEEFYQSGTHPQYRELIDDFINAGGRLPSPETTKGLIKSLSDALKDTGKALGDAKLLKTIDEAVDLTSTPIMQYLVPYAKLMHFALKREQALKEFNNRNWQGIPNSAKQLEWLKISQELVKFGDSMYGQLAYDNLMLRNSLKDALFFVVKYPGWNLGSGRWIKANVTGAYQGLKTLATGEKMKLFEQQSLRYTAGLLVKTAIFNTLLYYMLHGKTPDDPKELFYKGVWTGGYNSDGSKEYVRDADYLRDLIGVATDPVGTVKAKMPAGVAEAYQMLDNSDYFGNKVFSPGEPLKWPWQATKKIASMPVPYSVQQAVQGTSFVGKYGQMIGETKTPQRLSRTPLESAIADYYTRHAERGKTPEASERGKTVSDVQMLAIQGNMEGFEKGIQKLKAKNLITDKQEENMREKASVGVKRYRFAHMPLEDAIKAYAKGSKQEKAELEEILTDKWDRARDETQDLHLKAYEKAIGHKAD